MNIEQEISQFKRAMERNYPFEELQSMYEDLKIHVKQLDCQTTNCKLLGQFFKDARRDWKVMQKVLMND